MKLRQTVGFARRAGQKRATEKNDVQYVVVGAIKSADFGVCSYLSIKGAFSAFRVKPL